MKKSRQRRQTDAPEAEPRCSTRRSCAAGKPGQATQLEAARAWRSLGREALLAGNPLEALWYLRRSVESCADDPTAWQLLGGCFSQMGETRRAGRCYALAARQLARAGLGPEKLPGEPAGALGDI